MEILPLGSEVSGGLNLSQPLVVLAHVPFQNVQFYAGECLPHPQEWCLCDDGLMVQYLAA